jgi:hypothetical protein
LDWQTVLSTVVGVGAGGLITAYFARKSSKKLEHEAKKLRTLTLMILQILDGQGVIEVKEWDFDTGEPTRWPVGKSVSTSYNVEAPTPRWKRIWRRFRE